MPRTIDAVWAEIEAERMGCEVPDVQLSERIGKLKTSIAALRQTAEAKNFQAHYDAAHDVDTLTRRIRFRLSVLEDSSFDFRAAVQPLIAEAHKHMLTNSKAKTVVYAGAKHFNHMRASLRMRLEDVATRT